MAGLPFPGLRRRTKNYRLGVLLITPALLCIACVIVYPLLRGTWMSFLNLNLLRQGDGSFIGLGNYRAIFADKYFPKALWNTVVWTVWNVVLQVALGLLIASLLNTKLRGRGVYRTLSMIPWIIPSVVSALTWRWMFDWSNGIINAIALRWGLIEEAQAWLGTPATAMPAVVVASIWKGLPYVTVMLLAALQPIPPELYESASIDGANGWQKFYHVTIPMIRRTLAVATVLTTVFTVNNFNAIWLMTQGGPLFSTEILFTYAYKLAFQRFNFGRAAAASVLLFLVLTVLGSIYLYLMDREEVTM